MRLQREQHHTHLLVGLLTHPCRLQVTQLFSGYVVAALQQYAGSPAEHWRAKDGAVYLVVALAVQGTTAAEGARATNELVNILDFFSQVRALPWPVSVQLLICQAGLSLLHSGVPVLHQHPRRACAALQAGNSRLAGQRREPCMVFCRAPSLFTCALVFNSDVAAAHRARAAAAAASG